MVTVLARKLYHRTARAMSNEDFEMVYIDINPDKILFTMDVEPSGCRIIMEGSIEIEITGSRGNLTASCQLTLRYRNGGLKEEWS